MDPEWQRESLDPKQLSHDRKFPSKWRAAAPYQDPLDTVRIIDQFVIRQKDKPSSSETKPSSSETESSESEE